mmetsp:Transcript_36795/g.52002  ORF Transcript_36795/g.52002 Transcript_36795/m.52002 type:complete len:141 (+) Transcript_36795:92-514(+)
MGILTVFLDKLTNLRDEDGFGRSDPYVKFHLEQDNMVFDKNYGRQTSSTKNNRLNPVYGETFTFGGVPTMNNMVLHIRVWDSDIGIGTDDKLGECTVKLENMGLSEEPKEHVQKIDEKNGGWFSKDARIHLQLSYKEDEE